MTEETTQRSNADKINLAFDSKSERQSGFFSFIEMFDHSNLETSKTCLLSTTLCYSVNGANEMNSYKNKSVWGQKTHVFRDTTDLEIKCKL